MGSATSDPPAAAPPDATAPSGRKPLTDAAETGLKIVVVGGFGVGKTTLVRSVSEIRPLNTEEVMTQAGVGVDETGSVTAKTTTTVAFDFGRISLNDRMVLYLFGAPGQERFWFLWDRLFSGTLGAVVLVDTRRMDDSWYAIDRLEHHRTPFVVAVNRFDDDTARHSLDEIRQALALPDHVPLIDCDARVRTSGKTVLVTLVDHLYQLALAQESAS
ncbi:MULTISPECIES: GTP-binding protein [Streptomyces]|uniref:GTP-binding protein n=1 Tax=Streptomyces ardesiacus TaxID=285564 RepID=A0ABW8HDE2_9ACTN|nr:MULTISPECIES: ATP/GTP-binding protein [Streptomyces]KOT94132.1 ATP-binding protein [Streptomyces sp. NRRL F-4711]KOX27933.1 ATP-binding protein [Streptomyces sp. NRRL F-4707]KOX46483.1 ATP-binding protein [Streptomyces sp. NRRL F-7442]MCL7366581.1 ATP/GTP-binding protein [Streptomyces ardesiacus]